MRLPLNLVVEVFHVQVCLRFCREHDDLLTKCTGALAMHSSERFTILSFLIVLALRPLEVHPHFCPLLLRHDVRTLCLVPLRPNDLAFLVQSHEVVIHPPDRDELLFENLLLLDKECLSLADGACNLLTGALRLELQL